MEWFWASLGLIFVIAVIRPLFWWVALGTSLWLGRKVCNEAWGRRVFGRYW